MNDGNIRHRAPSRCVGRATGAVLAAAVVTLLTAGCPGSGSGGGGGYGSTDGEIRSEGSGTSAPSDQR